MKKVLVLEDEANIRSFVVINLKRAGYETIEAENGEEALEQLRLNPDVRVALLDIMPPDMDGFRGLPPDSGGQLQDWHHHAHRPDPGDGQGHRVHDRGGRLCDQTLSLRRN